MQSSIATPETPPVPFGVRLGDNAAGTHEGCAGIERFGNATAIVTGGGTVISYRELAQRVRDTADRFGDGRKLVMIHCANELEPLVAYLAAVSAGMPALLVADGDRRLERAYDPDVVVLRDGDGWAVEARREHSAHELHPDLTLLLSTSGSTGSPKLVRLSAENLASNAEAIARYLRIDGHDRSATTLPMQYCYGLSVVNSHLARGAALLLTDLSVVNECFWRFFREHGGTNFAGVPFTFELLDRTDFAQMSLPSLRFVTQAGGRLEPATVRRYAELGRRDGWELFVMYGQTEATARMAYLPPELAADRPSAIGVPIPGGEFEIAPHDDADSGGDAGEHADAVGELIYRGPNVMLGYAESPRDLSLGRTVGELRTGDLARRAPDGLFEIVGRRTKFAKLFGLRIDLTRVEEVLASHGVCACCVSDDRRLVVAATGPLDEAAVRAIVKREFGLPPAAVRLLTFDELPRLANGKLDRAALLRAAECDGVHASAGAPGPTARLCALYEEVLGSAQVTPASTFVSLGGDSLSYVEMSVALEEELGDLPSDWHVTPISRLADVRHPTTQRSDRMRRVETSVLVRAVAIVLIVGSHTDLFKVLGSAHVLIAVAGFNFARFLLGPGERAARLRSQARSTLRIAIPSVAWVAFAHTALTDQYTWADVFLLDAIVGPAHWTPQWHFWFVEVLLYTMIVLAAVMAIPAVDRAERRAPFAFPVALLAWGLVLRFDVIELGLTNTKPVFWLFALGWVAARATTAPRRGLVTAVTLAAVPSFFDDAAREAVIVGGLLLLTWRATVPIPRALSGITAVLASASLYIYLTHWQVFRHMLEYPLLGVGASIAVGVTYWLVASRVVDRLLDSLRAIAPGRRDQAEALATA